MSRKICIYILIPPFIYFRFFEGLFGRRVLNAVGSRAARNGKEVRTATHHVPTTIAALSAHLQGGGGHLCVPVHNCVTLCVRV